jgi:hypothetical protein
MEPDDGTDPNIQEISAEVGHRPAAVCFSRIYGLAGTMMHAHVVPSDSPSCSSVLLYKLQGIALAHLRPERSKHNCRPQARKDREAYSRPLARYMQHTPKRAQPQERMRVEGVELISKQAMRGLAALPPEALQPGRSHFVPLRAVGGPVAA